MWEIATRKFPYDEYEQYKNTRTTALTQEQLHDEKFCEELSASGWYINRETATAIQTSYNKHKFIDLIVNVSSSTAVAV